MFPSLWNVFESLGVFNSEISLLVNANIPKNQAEKEERVFVIIAQRLWNIISLKNLDHNYLLFKSPLYSSHKVYGRCAISFDLPS